MIIDTLIFSKNRAMQLDALLKSILKFSPWVFQNLTILFSATTIEYVEAYKILMNEYKGKNINWDVDYYFEGQFLDWLKKASTLVMFLTDDDLFYAKASTEIKIPWSYRVGEFDYLLSLDGCVYDKSTIKPLLDFHFDNPSDLEAGLFQRQNRFHFKLNHNIPCLVGVNANRVSDSPGAPFWGSEKESAQYLNNLFLRGLRIDLETTLNGVDVTNNHMEIHYGYS